MISAIIKSSVHNRGIVIFLFCLVGLFSIYSLKTANIDAIPDIGENQQIVFTSWQGRSPQDVEDQVTYPLSVELQGVPGVKEIRGSSAFGMSNIYVIFHEGVDFYWSRSRLLERLANAGRLLPEGAQMSLGPDATGLGQVFWYTVENREDALNPKSLQELRSIQDFYVRFHLQAVEGVSEVASIGGFVKEYQIDIDPNKIFAYDTHFTAIIQAIKNSNLDVGAEVIEDGPREMIVRGLGQFTSLEDIEQVVVTTIDGAPVRVKDLGQVQVGPAFRRGALDKNGQEAVGGVVTMRYGENPAQVLERVKIKIKEIAGGLPEGVEIVPFYDRTQLIQRTIGTVYSALSVQILITSVVILLFLMHLRSSILVALTLPFGVGISFIFMGLLGIDSNIMSLAGLVISIGAMVDMGVILTENIYSALGQNPGAKGRERVKIVTDAASEVGPAVFMAVTTTIITFLPVFGLQGAEGKLFGPLAWAKTMAMFGAVLVSVILVPALSVFLLKGNLKPLEDIPLSRLVLKLYRPTLLLVLNYRIAFLGIIATILLTAALAMTRLGSEFMPSLNEGDLLYMPVSSSDISITQARELLSYTDRKLVEHPLVEYAVGKLGRAQTALDPAPISMFETVIKLVDESKWPSGMSIYDVKHELDQHLQVPGLVNAWGFPIQIRIGMISTGIRAPIGVKIFGDDLDELQRLSREVSEVLNEVPGARGVYPEQITGKPYIEFKIDRVKASRFGINTKDVNQILQTAVGGMPIGEFLEGRERYPIRIRYKKELRDNIELLKRVLIPSPLGHHIPLEDLAHVEIVDGPSMIQSENGILRSIVISNVYGRDLIGFVEEARARVAQSVNLPPGYSIAWAGEYEDKLRANERLRLLLPLSLVFCVFIIYLGMRSLSHSLIVFSAVPIAFSGGVLLLWLGGYSTSVAVWVGFIALFGICVDDGVVMMTYLRESLRSVKPSNWEELRDCILEAGSRRVRPLIMTTTTTVIALLPVMVHQGTGAEIMRPMAIPTIGGMLMALVSLFVVPVVFSFVEFRRIQKEKVFN